MHQRRHRDAALPKIWDAPGLTGQTTINAVSTQGEKAMDDTSRKSALIDLIKKARAEQRAFWDGLSQARRSAQGAPDHWSPKDVAAHIIVWNDRLAANLEAAARGDAPQQYEDFEAANRQIFEANRERSLEDLL
jgi:hypothetical protein